MTRDESCRKWRVVQRYQVVLLLAPTLAWAQSGIRRPSGPPSSKGQRTRFDVVIRGKAIDATDDLRRLIDITRDGRTDRSMESQLRAVLNQLDYSSIFVWKRGRVVITVRPLPMVRRVFVKGNWPLFEDEIRRRLRFRPGQRLPEASDRQSALRAQEQRVQRFLARQGYFDGTLRVETGAPGPRGGVDLEVVLSKGRSYRLGPLSAEYVERRSDQTDRLDQQPARLSLAKLRSFFDHKVAFYRRAFNTDRLAKDLDRLKTHYHQLGYPGVRLSHRYRVDPCAEPDRAVRLELRIDPRRRILVTFEGVQHFDEATLRKELTLADSQAYDDYELANSANRIRRRYQQNGFLQARVRFARKRDESGTDRVVFRVEEGPQIRVERIDFEGNRELSDEELQAAIRTRPFPFLGRLGLQGGGYVTDLQLRQDVRRVRQLYRRRGYSQARVSGTLSPDPRLIGRPGAVAAVLSTQGLSERGRAYVRFTVEEGKQLRIGAVRVATATEAPELEDAGPERQSSGSDAPDDIADRPNPSGPGASQPLSIRQLSDSPPGLEVNEDVLIRELSQVGLASGMPFTQQRVKRAKRRLVTFFAERGYPYTEVGGPLEVSHPETQGVELQFSVKSGKQVHIGPIFVRGNFKTRASTILRAIGLQPGQVFDIRRIRKAERILRTLKVFNSVRVRLLGLQREPSDVPILIRVQERYDDHGSIEFGVGGSSDNRFFGSLSYVNQNLLGFGTRFSARGELGLEIQSGNLRFTDPRLFGSAFVLDTAAFVRKQITERLGDLLTFGATLTVSRELLPRLQAFARYEIRRVKRQEDLNRPAGEFDESRQVDVFTTTAGVGPALVYEARDRPLSPTRGFRLAASAFFATKAFGGTDDFVKISGNGQYYLRLPWSSIVALGVRYDQGIPLGDRVVLPKVERFFAGGDTTIRGFDEDRAFAERVRFSAAPFLEATNVRVIPQGGNIRLLSNLELQFPIWKQSPLLGRDLLAAVFFDNALVTNSFRGAQWHDFRHSLGTALRIVLPVGFASFEWAWPLDPKVGDSSWRFHFNFGFIL